MTLQDDHTYMRVALEEAELARQRDEVPIGAVLVDKITGKIVARAGNRTIEQSDPTAHAEINVIRHLCSKLNSQRIPDYDLYVTLEPCTMCAAAIAFARIPRLIIGASDEKGGGVMHGVKFFEQPTCHHKMEISHGVIAEECSSILKEYFRSKRG